MKYLVILIVLQFFIISNGTLQAQWVQTNEPYGGHISCSAVSGTNIVYNTLGQSIKTLESGFKIAGNYSITFNASDLPINIYFYKLEAGQFSELKKMMFIK